VKKEIYYKAYRVKSTDGSFDDIFYASEPEAIIRNIEFNANKHGLDLPNDLQVFEIWIKT